MAILVVGALPEGDVADVVLGVTLVAGLTVGQVAYYVALQRRKGRTLGKRLVGTGSWTPARRCPRRERW